MEKEPEYKFTAAQYAALSDEEKKAIHKVAEYLLDDELKVLDDETLSETFNILRPCGGCVPDEEIGEDLLSDIRRKFACVYSSALDLATQKLEQSFWSRKDFSFELVIDPSWEDATTIAVTDYDNDERPFCYFEDSWKAWGFEFEGLKEIATEVLRARDEIVSRFVSLAKERLRRAEKKRNRGGKESTRTG